MIQEEVRNTINIRLKFFFYRFYLFERGKRRERVREGEKHQAVASQHTPNWGPGWEPRHVS